MPADKAGAAIHEATTFPNFLIVFSFESKYEAKRSTANYSTP